jgi:hypothetical protein
VDNTINELRACLEGDMPEVGKAAMGGDCEYCSYSKERTALTLKHLNIN